MGIIRLKYVQDFLRDMQDFLRVYSALMTGLSKSPTGGGGFSDTFRRPAAFAETHPKTSNAKTSNDFLLERDMTNEC